MNDYIRNVKSGRIPIEAKALGKENGYAIGIAILLFTSPDFRYQVAAETLYSFGIVSDRLVDLYEKCGQNMTILKDVAEKLRFGEINPDGIDSYISSIKSSGEGISF